jgi:hypothetical protein
MIGAANRSEERVSSRRSLSYVGETERERREGERRGEGEEGGERRRRSELEKEGRDGGAGRRCECPRGRVCRL